MLEERITQLETEIQDLKRHLNTHSNQHEAHGNDEVYWVGSVMCGSAANRPTNGGIPGGCYYATDTHAWSIWDGSAWDSVTLS